MSGDGPTKSTKTSTGSTAPRAAASGTSGVGDPKKAGCTGSKLATHPEASIITVSATGSAPVPSIGTGSGVNTYSD